MANKQSYPCQTIIMSAETLSGKDIIQRIDYPMASFLLLPAHIIIL